MRLIHMTPLASIWQVVHARNKANGASLRWAARFDGDEGGTASASPERARFEAALAGWNGGGNEPLTED